MNSIPSTAIRILAFVRKEVFEILRQPRLLFTLILGPFLILLIFGIGYRNTPRELRTLFVMSEESALRERVEEYATTLGPQLIYAGVTDDAGAALKKLRNGQVDLVAVAPANATENIRSNQPAVFTLYHREIDPLQVDYVRFFGKTYMQEINRRVLVRVAKLGQSDAATIRENIEAARREAAKLQQALESENISEARQYQARLSHYVDTVYLALGSSLSVLSSIEDDLGATNGTDPEEFLTRLQAVREDINNLDDFLTRSEHPPPGSERIDQIQRDLSMLESRLEQFTSINASILVRPFRRRSSLSCCSTLQSLLRLYPLSEKEESVRWSCSESRR